jgi:anti-sigma B factor antagonist
MSYSVTGQAGDGGTHIVAAAGEIDLYAAPELKQQVVRSIEEGGTRLIIDLSETTFIDSTGVGVLVGALKRVRESGGGLALVCTNDNVLRVLEIVGLNQLFPIHESRDEATASLLAAA